MMICSARAQEADLATGGNCSNSMHSDGSTPMFMTLNGSSMATSVVAGASAMAREFLREEVGIATPGSDLIRALLVNGAEQEPWLLVSLIHTYITFSLEACTHNFQKPILEVTIILLMLI